MKKHTRTALQFGRLVFCLGLILCGTRRITEAQQPVEINVAAPELIGGPWLNTAKYAPIKMASRRGKVTIVEFWTFG